MEDISQRKEHPAKKLMEVIQTDDPSQIEVFLSGLEPGDEVRCCAVVKRTADASA